MKSLEVHFQWKDSHSSWWSSEILKYLTKVWRHSPICVLQHVCSSNVFKCNGGLLVYIYYNSITDFWSTIMINIHLVTAVFKYIFRTVVLQKNLGWVLEGFFILIIIWGSVCYQNVLIFCYNIFGWSI